ncbi:MAG: hypothetical protein ACYC5M_07035 [Anaerolineae bacterium]
MCRDPNERTHLDEARPADTESSTPSTDRAPDDQPGPRDPGSLLRSALRGGDLEGADLQRIDEELRLLLEARAYFEAWAKELREGGKGSLSPAQYMRAWNDSTTRVVQLLRARRALAVEDDEAQGPFGALIADVYDITDGLLVDALDAAGKEDHDDA